jgi:peptidoglycan/LPS O-acetylase OafA/YrhL
LFPGALFRGWNTRGNAQQRGVPTDLTAPSGPSTSPAPSAAPGDGRFLPLDGLRGAGAIGVLAMHAFPLAFYWNWIWMEMFFVLSGFLITTILLRTDFSQPGALRNFMARRALRIWPVYYVGLSVAFLMWQVFSAYKAIDFQPVWWKCLVYLQFTEGYTQLDQAYTFDYVLWFRHTWSLAVEEQYYLLWPLVLLLSGGRRPVLLATCLLLLATCIWMRASGYALNMLLTRGDGFALGSILALLEDQAPRSHLLRQWLKILYAACLAFGLVVIVPYIVSGYAEGAIRSYPDIQRFGDWTLNVAAAALLFFGLIGLMRRGLLESVGRVLSASPLTWLGGVSYAIYLFQELVFGVVHQFLHLERHVGAVAAGVLAMAIAVAIGPLSRRFLENPFNRLKRHFPVITRDGAIQQVQVQPAPARDDSGATATAPLGFTTPTR